MYSSDGWWWWPYPDHTPLWKRYSQMTDDELASTFAPKGHEYLAEMSIEHAANRKVALDIGANSGCLTYRYALNFDVVHSFEPVPDFMACIRANTCHLPNIVYHQYALSDHNGSQKFYQSKITKGGTSSFQLSMLASSESNAYKEIKVPTVKLDSLNIRGVGMIKIDVEGHELEMLEGGRDTIERDHPAIVVEVKYIGQNYGPLIEKMESFGYSESRAIKVHKHDWLFTV